MASRSFGFSKYISKSNRKRNINQLRYKIPNEKRVTPMHIVDMVKSYYTRDEVSRSTAGKKETITISKEKRQKRFLLQSVSKTYKTFQHEHPSVNLSFTTFYRLKPFWVVRPRIQDCVTCLCQIHENVQYMHTKLKQLSVVHSESPHLQVYNMVCDGIDNKNCMSRDCIRCASKTAISTKDPSTDKSANTWWWQWRVVTEDLGSKKIKKTKKVRVCDTISKLESDYDISMKKFCRHIFNVKHQENVCRQKRLNLQNDELWLHIDFAENYCCKSLNEVQAKFISSSQ